MTRLADFLHQPVIIVLGWSLLHFLWQGVLVALVVAAMLRSTRRASAQTRYALAGAGMLALLACPIMTFNVLSQGRHDSGSDTVSNVAISRPVSASGGDAEPAFAAPAPLIDQLANLPRSLPASRYLPLLVIAWGTCVGVLSLRLVAGWLRVQQIRGSAVPVANRVIRARLAEISRRMGIKSPVALLEAALVPGPSVIGFLRPAILFPAAALTGLFPIQIEAILAHELAHIRRHDYLVNLLQSVVETLLFYHPAVWWVSAKIRQEREHCCDDLAVEVCGDRAFYATCLADLDELRPSSLALAVGASDCGLLPRIRRILSLPAGENRAPAAAAGAALVATAAVALLLMVTPAGAQRRAIEMTLGAANSSPTPDHAHVPKASPIFGDDAIAGRGASDQATITVRAVAMAPRISTAIPSASSPAPVLSSGARASPAAANASAPSPDTAANASAMPRARALPQAPARVMPPRNPAPVAPPAPPLFVPFPNVRSEALWSGRWLPRFTTSDRAASRAGPMQSQVNPRPSNPVSIRPLVSDFPAPSQRFGELNRAAQLGQLAAETLGVRLVAPVTQSGGVAPEQSNRGRQPVMVNYNGLLVVAAPRNYVSTPGQGNSIAPTATASRVNAAPTASMSMHPTSQK